MTSVLCLLCLLLSSAAGTSPSTAVVTGATKGIGYAVAAELASQPSTSTVIVCSRSALDVEACVAELNNRFPGKVSGCAADVSTEEGRRALVDFARKKLPGGTLDCLVNNVGTNIRKPTVDYSEEEVRARLRGEEKGFFIFV